MRNFLAGLSVGLIIGFIVMYLYNDTGIKETNIDERVEREIDSLGYHDMTLEEQRDFIQRLARERIREREKNK
jgi:hypothetical protein